MKAWPFRKMLIKFSVLLQEHMCDTILPIKAFATKKILTPEKIFLIQINLKYFNKYITIVSVLNNFV